VAKSNNLKEVPYGTSSRWVPDLPREEWPRVTRLMEYVSGYGTTVEWRPNEPFLATLKLERLERGRSAARFWFSDPEGTEYPFFGQGLTEMLQKVTLDHGVVTGVWIAVKRGANYGIELYEDEN
jgi:hypothetical protein